MKQEEKSLLLKDLCARLPYGVKVRTPYNDAILRGIVDRKGVKITIDYTDIVTDKQTYPIRYIKLYLRPMSSMTEEEKKEFIDATDGELRYSEVFDVIRPMYESEDYCVSFVSYLKSIDWLNAHHFDYRGLIPLGLAIEVTEDNNPYKK